MKLIARAAVLIAFATVAGGCTTLPGGRKAATAETDLLSVPEVARPYLEQLIRRVDRQWNREIARMKTYPPIGSKVVIRFHMNSAGLITRIDDVDENAGKAGTYLCLDAITSPQPYPKWTEEMIESIGEEQEITFTFYYYKPDARHDSGEAGKNPLPVGAHSG